MFTHRASIIKVLSLFDESVPRTYDEVFDELGNSRHDLNLSCAPSLFEFLHYTAMAEMLKVTGLDTFVLTPQGRDYIQENHAAD